MVQFHVLTLFPDIFQSPLAQGVVGRACENGLLGVSLHNIRDYTHDRHRTVDDYAFGGGPGMLMKPGPIFDGVKDLKGPGNLAEDVPIILLTPQGRTLTQHIVEDLAAEDHIVLICGRYEGVDSRVHQYLATDEISVGDYVLSGGELPAMVLIEAVARLVPGVLGSIESSQDDSFSNGLLQEPQFTRPSDYRGWVVPEVLLSGNHAEILKWRRRESIRRTLEKRPDLLENVELSADEDVFLQDLRSKES